MLDKRLIYFFVGSALLLALIVLVVIVMAFYFRKGKNNFFMEKRRLLLANLEEGDRMMNQISKEVHDNIGQLCHLLYMTLDKIEKTVDREAQVKVICQARQLTDTIIFNADNVSNSLNSDYIKRKGLSNILQCNLELIRSLGKMNCSIEFHGEIRPFHPDKELLIYRIAQEAIHNALKHAEASTIRVALSYSNKIFRMKIKDDGKGFDVTYAMKKGIGLANMKERANIVNGKLAINSSPGKGCSVGLSMALD